MYQIQFYIVDSSPDGLVMQKKTLKWKPSTEKTYLCDEMLKDEVNMALLLGGGGHQRCEFRGTLKCTDVSLGFLIA